MENLSLWKLDEKFVSVMQKIDAQEGVLDEALEKEMDEVMKAMAQKPIQVIQAKDTVNSMIVQGKKWIAKFQAKVKSLENSLDRMDSALINHMETLDTDKIKTNLGLLRVMSSERTIVDDKEKLPSEFLNVVVEYKPKKGEIKKAIKSGIKVPGVHLESHKYIKLT